MAGAFNPDLGAGSAAPVGGTPTVSGGAAAIGSALESVGGIADSFFRDKASRDSDKPTQSFLDNEALKPYARELDKINSGVKQGKISPREANVRASTLTSQFMTRHPGLTSDINSLFNNYMGFEPSQTEDKLVMAAEVKASEAFFGTEIGSYHAAIAASSGMSPEEQGQYLYKQRIKYQSEAAAAQATVNANDMSTAAVQAEIGRYIPVFNSADEAFHAAAQAEIDQYRLNNEGNQFAAANLLTSVRSAYDRAMAEVEAIGNHNQWMLRDDEKWTKVKKTMFPKMRRAINMLEKLNNVNAGETPSLAKLASEIGAKDSLLVKQALRNLDLIPVSSESSDTSVEVALKVIENLGGYNKAINMTQEDQQKLWEEMVGAGKEDLTDFEKFVDDNLIAFAQIKKDPASLATWTTLSSKAVSAAVEAAGNQNDARPGLNIALAAARSSDIFLSQVLKDGKIPTPASIDQVTSPSEYKVIDSLAQYKDTPYADTALQALDIQLSKAQNIRDFVEKDLVAKLNYGNTTDVVRLERGDSGYTMKVNPESEVGKALVKEGFSLDQRGISEYVASPQIKDYRYTGKAVVAGAVRNDIRELDRVLKGGGMGSFNSLNKLQKMLNYGTSKVTDTAPATEAGVVNSNSESPAVVEKVGEVSFEDVIAPVLAEEGGYADDPDDSGGKTNFGITEATARRNGFKGDMKNLTKEEATKIYEVEYYAGPKIDKLPPEVRELAFDGAVNHGPATSIRFVQEAINEIAGEGTVDVDGKIGEATIEAANSIDPEELKVKTALIRRDYYVSIAKNKKSQLKYFRSRSGGKGGWIKRVEKYLPEDLRWDNEEFGAIVSEIQTA